MITSEIFNQHWKDRAMSRASASLRRDAYLAENKELFALDFSAADQAVVGHTMIALEIIPTAEVGSARGLGHRWRSNAYRQSKAQKLKTEGR